MFDVYKPADSPLALVHKCKKSVVISELCSLLLLAPLLALPIYQKQPWVPHLIDFFTTYTVYVVIPLCYYYKPDPTQTARRWMFASFFVSVRTWIVAVLILVDLFQVSMVRLVYILGFPRSRCLQHVRLYFCFGVALCK
jgi:hypothetical protein